MTYLRCMIALLAIALLTIPEAHAAEVQTLTAVQLGMNGVSLSTTPESVVVDMDSKKGFFNQLTFVCAVTWGTSTVMNARAKGSHDATIYGWIDHCTGVNPKLCKPMVLQFDKADNTDGLITIELKSNYVHYILELDDPGSNSGTIVCTAGRGRQ